MTTEWLSFTAEITDTEPDWLELHKT